MIGLAEVVFILLIIITLIDLYVRKIPAIFLTGGIFLIAVVSFYLHGVIPLVYGVFALLLALMLYEGQFFGGVADIKVMIMIGMMVSSIYNFFAMMLFTLFFGLSMKIILVYGMKWDQKEEIPFIPVLLIVYMALYFLRGVI